VGRAEILLAVTREHEPGIRGDCRVKSILGRCVTDSLSTVFAGRVRKIAKGDFRHIRLSFRPSVCPHGTTRLPLDGFS
jgi:hypothetical protein